MQANPQLSHTIDLNLINQIDSTEGGSVWCLLLSHDDKFLFVGQSDGKLRIFNLTGNTPAQYPVVYANQNIHGITHLKHLTNHDKVDSYLILLVRVNGVLEFIRCNHSSAAPLISLIDSSRIHTNPITQICHGGSYLITATQDFTIKIIKIAMVKDDNMCLNVVGQEQSDSQPTAICIEESSAAIGTQSGLICIWNLQTARCLFQLKTNQMADKAITSLIMVRHLVISLNEDHQMCIWNRHRGEMLKEFTFFSLKSASIYGRRSGQKLAFFTYFIKRIYQKLSKRLYESTELTNNEELNSPQPLPSMCLYSNSLLITGGCGCIFVWNIIKGELVKKINLKKPLAYKTGHKASLKENKYAQKYWVKQIELVRQRQRLLLIVDYTDSIFLLRIPTYLIDTLE